MATSSAADAKIAGTPYGTLAATSANPRPLIRLLRYVVPYWWQFLASVALMALVGLLDAGRVLLIGPIFDRVLNPGSQDRTIQLFRMPGTGRFLDLDQLIPSHFQNPWTMVAFALVAATVLKGIFDYAGTYLVNYAGFGMITDLRDNLYNAILRSSAAFFTKHTTGTLLSTIVNDIEKVQFAMSSVLSEFLQQFFTFIFTAAVVVLLGGKLAWVLLLFVPVILYSSRKIGRQVRSKTRGGQDKLAEIQNILHETITGNRIVKAFGMERWEMERFRAAARRLFEAIGVVFALRSLFFDDLLRARAVENQAYVLAPAQGGHHRNGRDTWGHSMIIDPWGTILAEGGAAETGVLLAKIDPAKVETARKTVPSLQHGRRFSVADPKAGPEHLHLVRGSA